MVKRIVLVLVACFLSLNFAFADEEKPSILGKTLDKTLSPLDILLTPSKRLDPIVVTPTRYDDPSLTVSKNVTVITADQIEKSHVRYVPDLLRKEVGVVVSDLLGNGKATRIDMRGFGDSAISNVLVLVDGRRTNQIDMSGADWTQIDVDAIEKIEIARGPQTVMYGDNATGGVINIITKSGKGKKPEIGFKYETGSYKYNSYKGHVAGGTDFLDYFGMVSSSNNNGYRINNHFETVDYDAKLTLKPADYFRLRFSTGYHRDWYGLPGAVKPVDINSIGRKGSLYPDSRASTDDYYYMMTPEIDYDLGFGEIFCSSEVMFRARRTNSSMPAWVMARANHIKTFGVTPKAAFTTNLFGIDNRIMAGLDFYGSRSEITDGWLPQMDEIVINKDTTGLYITDTVSLPINLVLNGGARGEWATYKFDQQAQLTGRNEKESFEYAYDVGLTYSYNEKSSVYATYSRSFRFPVTDEWYQSMYFDWSAGRIAGGLNLDLKPQVGYNYEIGIKENSSKYVSLKADYYLTTTENELYFDSVTHANSIYPDTVRSGVELETSFYLLDMVHAFANYTYENAYFVGGSFDGNEIPMVPQHKVSAGFDYTFYDCINIIYTANYVEQRWFANDLQNCMPKLNSYLLHNIRMSYKKYGFEFFTAINNLSDIEYSEYGALTRDRTRPGYYPSPRRNFTMGISFKF